MKDFNFIIFTLFYLLVLAYIYIYIYIYIYMYIVNYSLCAIAIKVILYFKHLSYVSLDINIINYLKMMCLMIDCSIFASSCHSMCHLTSKFIFIIINRYINKPNNTNKDSTHLYICNHIQYAI